MSGPKHLITERIVIVRSVFPAEMWSRCVLKYIERKIEWLIDHTEGIMANLPSKDHNIRGCQRGMLGRNKENKNRLLTASQPPAFALYSTLR